MSNLPKHEFKCPKCYCRLTYVAGGMLHCKLCAKSPKGKAYYSVEYMMGMWAGYEKAMAQLKHKMTSMSKFIGRKSND